MRYSAVNHLGWFLAGLLAVCAGGCGGFNAELAHRQGGYFDPEAVLPGQRIGYMLVRDRNGNVKSSARVEQTCRTENRMEGECRTELLDGDAPLDFPHESRYHIHHEDNLDVTVTWKSSLGEQKGIVRGNHLLLWGQRRLPDNDTGLSVETRFHKLAGDGSPLMQIDSFSRFGIEVGSIYTTWIPAP